LFCFVVFALLASNNYCKCNLRGDQAPSLSRQLLFQPKLICLKKIIVVGVGYLKCSS
jgi:hypothetical protein